MIQTATKDASGRLLPVDTIRKAFPIFSSPEWRELLYLDNAATTQRPQRVLDAIAGYYADSNANVHRGAYALSEKSTGLYESARRLVGRFVGAPSPKQVVFTKNATEALNLVAHAWALPRLQPGLQILVTEMEHHSNLVPWQVLAQRTGATLSYVRVDDSGRLDLDDLRQKLRKPTLLVAVTQASNVLGTLNPVAKVVELAKEAGAAVVVDGAQSVPHGPVDFGELGCDFLAFSGHKMLGPMGIGVLVAKEERLEEAEPFLYGGDMIATVDWHQSTWNELPWKFEAGTPNVAGAVGLAEAVRFLQEVGLERIAEHDRALTELACDGLAQIDGVRIFGPPPDERVGLVAFDVDGVHPHDMATFLDARGIAIRAGHHCAEPLMKQLGVVATARVSFYLYNSPDDVEALIEGVKAAKEFFSP